MKAPCLNCKSRKIGCHDGCNKYQNYREKLKTRDAEEQEYVAYLVDTMERYRRYCND